MDSTTTGKIGELIGIVELIKLGHDVYRPVKDDNNIDYIITKDNVTTKIQIRSSTTVEHRDNSYMFRFLNEVKNCDKVLCVCLNREYNLIALYFIPLPVNVSTIHVMINSTISKWSQYRIK